MVPHKDALIWMLNAIKMQRPIAYAANLLELASMCAA
jgi:hypothetical protein